MSPIYKTNAILTIKGHSIEVCIKRKTDAQKQDDIGIGNVRLRFVGNVVNSGVLSNPKLFPKDVKVLDRADIVIDDENIRGEFVIEDIHRTRFKAVEKTLGQTFTGFIIPAKEYTEDDWS